MAATGIIHHVGTFLLFAAAILLLITTISSPVVNDIGILKVMLSNSSDFRHSSVTFGTFGHCVLDVAPANTDQDSCSRSHIGYNPSLIMSQIDGTHFNLASEDTAKGLTRVMILHPIATGLAFIAFLLALGAGLIGSLLASIMSFITFIVTLVVIITDAILFGIVKKHVNNDGAGSHAYFSIGMWTLVAALILLFLATFIVLFSCCSARRHRRRDTVSKEPGYVAGNGATTTTTKRHFWQRRNKY